MVNSLKAIRVCVLGYRQVWDKEITIILALRFCTSINVTRFSGSPGQTPVFRVAARVHFIPSSSTIVLEPRFKRIPRILKVENGGVSLRAGRNSADGRMERFLYQSHNVTCQDGARVLREFPGKSLKSIGSKPKSMERDYITSSLIFSYIHTGPHSTSRMKE